MDSILTSTKLLLGITGDYTPFDQQIIMHINTAFMILAQLGVGSSTPFVVESQEDTWDDFFSGFPMIETVKTYIYLRVRLLFDPPVNSSVLDSIKEQITELEHRMVMFVETPPAQ